MRFPLIAFFVMISSALSANSLTDAVRSEKNHDATNPQIASQLGVTPLPPPSESVFLGAIGARRSSSQGPISFSGRPASAARTYLVMNATIPLPKELQEDLFKKSACGRRDFEIVVIDYEKSGESVSRVGFAYLCNGGCFGAEERTFKGRLVSMSQAVGLEEQICRHIWGDTFPKEDRTSFQIYK